MSGLFMTRGEREIRMGASVVVNHFFRSDRAPGERSASFWTEEVASLSKALGGPASRTRRVSACPKLLATWCALDPSWGRRSHRQQALLPLP
jgi:hypothetical protein